MSAQTHAPPANSPDPLQAISWGTAQDVSYPASGNTPVAAGPFPCNVLRLACYCVSGATGLRVARGNSAAAAIAACAPGTWLPGSMVDHVMILPGDYVAVVSNDSNTGNLNITQAL